MKRIFKNKKFQAFFLSFMLGTIIVLPNIIKGHGIYSLMSDFNTQQIPFNKMINDSIKNGSYLWTWYNELGSNFIGTFSFYNLFSPFNIIGYLFPSSWFEYLIGPIFILKYAIAGLTSYLFISRYVKNKNYALIGSLLYSFSGFQLTNILFYHFHDVVAFFPLLLYTLDNLVFDNKKIRFALVVALCAFTNWFFFIGEVVFVIIYFLVRVITKSYKITFKKFVQISVEAILGTLLAACVLIPSFLFTIGNPRVSSDKWTLKDMFRYAYSGNYIEIVRAFIMAPETMWGRAILSESNYSSLELYLPFVGCVLLISYVLKNIKKWPSILFCILLAFISIPILNSSFYLFNVTYYARNFYMIILIMSLLSALCLDSNIKIENGTMISILGYVIFFIGLLIFVIISGNSNIVYNMKYFLLSLVVSLLNIIILHYLYKIKKQHIKILSLLFFIIFFTFAWGNYVTKNYKIMNDEYFNKYLDSYKFLEKYSSGRINGDTACQYNLGYISNINYIKNFNSNINSSNFEFYGSINYGRHVSTIIEPQDKNLNDFLGVKYMISCDSNENIEQYGYEYSEDSGSYKIYKNPTYKEFGFGVNKYITEREFKKLSVEDRKKMLNNTIILNNSQIKKYKDLYDENNPVKYDLNKFEYKNNGFESKITSNKETLAIYTVPYDTGWKATVNGKKIDIEKVDNGMMAIRINKGENDIKFSYFTPGLKIGILLSIISALSLFLYSILWKTEGVKNEK